MGGSISLGRIRGIKVELNISVLVIVAIVVAGLTFGRFPEVYPGKSLGAYLAAGVASAVLLLASLLAHELSHALVARRNGIEVGGITLWLLGGVAQLRGEPRSPGADLFIAIIGPLASLVTGAVCGITAITIAATTGTGLTVGVFSYLAWINLILAVFNLIPAAPLDGGRVLRAALWWHSGNRVRSAITATRAGRAFGFALIAAGALLFVSGAGLNGLWLALTGLFLVSAAGAEEQQTRLNATLSGVRVSDIMTPKPVVADPQETVSDLIDHTVLTHRFSTYPLVHNGHLAGLVTLNRVRAVPADQRGTRRLSEIACPPDEVPTAHPQEHLIDLLPRMAGCSDGRAIVVDDEQHVIGVVTSSDISRAMQVRELSGPTPTTGPPQQPDMISHGEHHQPT
jgi:Zn-dependent protease/CBS domain-containing protein